MEFHQLPSHPETRGQGWSCSKTRAYLARCDIRKCRVGEDNRDIRLGFSFAFVHRRILLQIDCPSRGLLRVVGHLKLEDTIDLRMTGVL